MLLSLNSFSFFRELFKPSVKLREYLLELLLPLSCLPPYLLGSLRADLSNAPTRQLIAIQLFNLGVCPLRPLHEAEALTHDLCCLGLVVQVLAEDLQLVRVLSQGVLQLVA